MARLTGDRPILEQILWGLLPFLTTLLLWFILTWGQRSEDRILPVVILPSPVEVVKSFPSLWFDRELSRNAVKSLQRVGLGFFFASIIAIPLGMGMAASGQIRALGKPLIGVTSYLPIVALIPLILSWFGSGETFKIVFLGLATFIYIAPLSYGAVVSIDQVFVNTAYTLGAKSRQIFWYVLFKIAAADIWNIMRLSFGVGWTYIILAEMIDLGSGGLGSLILMSERRGPREHIYLILLSIVLIAFLIDMVFQVLGKLLFPYRYLKR